MVLIGQPEPRSLLRLKSLKAVAQRLTVRFHLAPLDEEHTTRYLQHQLRAAGCERQVFTDSAARLRLLHAQTRGLPRLLNTIACPQRLGGKGTSARYRLRENRRQIAWDATVRDAAMRPTRSSSIVHVLSPNSPPVSNLALLMKAKRYIAITSYAPYGLRSCFRIGTHIHLPVRTPYACPMVVPSTASTKARNNTTATIHKTRTRRRAAKTPLAIAAARAVHTSTPSTIVTPKVGGLSHRTSLYRL